MNETAFKNIVHNFLFCHLRWYFLLHSNIATEEYRNRVVYANIPPLTRTIISTRKRVFGRALHIVLYCRRFNHPIIVRSYRIILHHWRSLYNSRIRKDISFIAFNRTTVALNRTSFVRVLFHMQFFCHQFTDHFYFFRSYEYIVTSARAHIVKRTLHTHLN